MVSLISAFCTLVLWVDSRYMHKEMADMITVELRLETYTRSMKFYERKIDDQNHTPSMEETREYEITKQMVLDLTRQRNVLLGLTPEGNIK